MRKRRVIILAMSLLAVLGGVIWWATCRPAVPDPVYAGHPLSYWLDRSSPSNPLASEAGIQSLNNTLDSNAVPYLIHALKTQESLRSRLYRRVYLRLPAGWKRNLRAPTLNAFVLGGWGGQLQIKNGTTPIFVPGPISAGDLRLESCVLLSWLGPDARPAIPQLILVLREDDFSMVRWCAALALGKIANPDDKNALDALNAAILNDKDQVTKNWSGRALSDIATRAAAKAVTTNPPADLWHPKDDSRL